MSVRKVKGVQMNPLLNTSEKNIVKLYQHQCPNEQQLSQYVRCDF